MADSKSRLKSFLSNLLRNKLKERRAGKPLSPAYLSMFLFLSFLITACLIIGEYRLLLFYSCVLGIGILTHYLEQFPFKTTFNFLGKLLILVMIVNVFSTLGEFTQKFNPVYYDSALFRLETSLFGISPVIWVSEHIKNPYLTEWLQINYSFYFFFVILSGVLYYFRRNEEKTDFVFFSLTFGLLISYAGYIIIPAVGPRDAFDEPYMASQLVLTYKEPLQGFFLTQPLREALNHLEKIKTDAFPSGHTAITLLALRHFYLFSKKTFWLLLPFGLSIIAATIFCRYHYAVDVIAGILLFLIVMAVDKKMYKITRNILTRFKNWRETRLNLKKNP